MIVNYFLNWCDLEAACPVWAHPLGPQLGLDLEPLGLSALRPEQL